MSPLPLPPSHERTRTYVRVPIPLARLEAPNGATFVVRDEVRAGALLLIFLDAEGWAPPRELLLKRLLETAPVRAYVVSNHLARGDAGTWWEDRVLRDPEGKVARALDCEAPLSGVLLGVDGYLAGGPVAGQDALADLVLAITRQIAGTEDTPTPEPSTCRPDRPPVVGVLAPTFNRPDLARSLLLQLNNQTVRPDHVVIHQNGQAESYAWAIADIDTDIDVEWIHTPSPIPQDQWYEIPLRALIDRGCNAFFWCDHDDMYMANHIEQGLRTLSRGYDFSINDHCGVLFLRRAGFSFGPAEEFRAHDPGGHSSSMCFTRDFAVALADDLGANKGSLAFSDQVLNRVTKPRFRCYVDSSALTSVYVCHPGTVSSSHWLGET